MFFRKKKTDFTKMSHQEAIKHFFYEGVGLGDPDAQLTQEQLHEVLLSYRSALSSTRRGKEMAKDIDEYLTLHGVSRHDIPPSEGERAWSNRQRFQTGRTDPLLLWRTKISLWWEKLLHRR